MSFGPDGRSLFLYLSRLTPVLAHNPPYDKRIERGYCKEPIIDAVCNYMMHRRTFSFVARKMAADQMSAHLNGIKAKRSKVKVDTHTG